MITITDDIEKIGKYNLTAIILHFGNLDGGHYTAYMRNPSLLTFLDSAIMIIKTVGCIMMMKKLENIVMEKLKKPPRTPKNLTF